ncbi:MAG: hypothetical protein AABY18_08290 [Candidatus Thermoplasmatota archaeon]
MHRLLVGLLLLGTISPGCADPGDGAPLPTPETAPGSESVRHLLVASDTFDLCGTYDPVQGWEPCVNSYDLGAHNCAYIDNAREAGVVQAWFNVTDASDVELVERWRIQINGAEEPSLTPAAEGRLPLATKATYNASAFEGQQSLLFIVEPLSAGLQAHQVVHVAGEIVVAWTGSHVPNLVTGVSTCSSG